MPEWNPSLYIYEKKETATKGCRYDRPAAKNT